MVVFAVGDGHGRETEGKRTPDGFRENFFNNAVKMHVIRELKRHGVTVLDCSPESDDTPLRTRSERINKGINNVTPRGFASIHANAYGDGKTYNNVKGIEVFSHPEAPSDGGKLLAKYLHEFLIQGTKQVDRGIKTANFYMLRETDCPAALVECAFMTNKEEAKLLQDVNFQLECGVEITKGSLKYLGINWQPEKHQEKYEEILKEVSSYYKVWIKFIEEHQDEVNLKGLVEKLYYKCGVK